MDGVYFNTDHVSFSYNISKEPSDGYTLHCHNFYEVYYFLEGNVDYLVEGYKYKPVPDSLLLLAPHVFHGARINDSGPYQRSSLHFHADILAPERRGFLLSAFSVPDCLSHEEIYFTQVERFHLSAYFSALKECAFQGEEYREWALPICVEALLARIVSMRAQDSGFTACPEPVLGIIRYPNGHLEEDISLDRLSQLFYVSKHHMNKIFRKATGTTVIDYLLRKRIAQAQQLLAEGASAQDAALKSGFRDYSAFYRAYLRIMGHSPIQDRGVLPSFAEGLQPTAGSCPAGKSITPPQATGHGY